MRLPQNLPGPYGSALVVACRAAKEAGAILRQEFYRPGGPRGELGHCPADDQSEALIAQALLDAFPQWPLFGEEGGARRRGAAPWNGDHYWLIDPNDGTSAFQRGQRGASVSIALICRGRPVLGVVYAYAPPIGGEDLICWAEGAGPLRRNGAPCPNLEPGTLTRDSVVIISGSADECAMANGRILAPARYRSLPGIAYRLALVAVGEGDGAVSLGGPEDYDVAGGHALLIGVGGGLLTREGEPVSYGLDPRDRRGLGGGCFGGRFGILEDLAQRGWHRISARDSAYTKRLCRPRADRIASNQLRLNRAQGAILGQLVGDSLGSLVEFWSSEDVKAAFPGGVRRMAWGGVWGTLPGQPTDDSEMALSLARSLVAKGFYEGDAVAGAYAHWYGSKPFDMGRTTGMALGEAHRAAAAGESPMAGALRGRNPASQANGALTRVSPLGVFGVGALEDKLEATARQDASLTHPHPVCQVASALYCQALAFAIREGCSPQDTFDFAMERLVRGAKSDLAEGYGPLLERMRAAEEGSEPRADGPHQGWVLIAFQNAFFQLRHGTSLEEGLVQTIALGGDTDTNAAIAGALLGASYGADSLPSAWCRDIFACRPLAGLPDVEHPRDARFWPVDGALLAEHLLCSGGGG